MSQDHHCHNHALPDFGKVFLAGIVLNTGFVAAEVFFGLRANSLALLADAGHNASDVLSLFLSWGAFHLSRRQPSGRFTYGMRGSTIIASLLNAVMLLVVVGGIGWESIMRLTSPEPAAGVTVMAVAAAGVFVNGLTAWLFMAEQKHDLNIRSAYLHMAGDAAISLGVVISGGLMLATGWLWLDPLMSLAISIMIIFSTWSLFKESFTLAVQAVPKDIDPVRVKDYLKNMEGVREVHDLHIWAMSTTEIAASVHLVMQKGHPGDAFLKEIAHELEHDFNISHVTVQIEIGDTGTECALAPEHVV